MHIEMAESFTLAQLVKMTNLVISWVTYQHLKLNMSETRFMIFLFKPGLFVPSLPNLAGYDVNVQWQPQEVMRTPNHGRAFITSRSSSRAEGVYEEWKEITRYFSARGACNELLKHVQRVGQGPRGAIPKFLDCPKVCLVFFLPLISVSAPPPESTKFLLFLSTSAWVFHSLLTRNPHYLGINWIDWDSVLNTQMEQPETSLPHTAVKCDISSVSWVIHKGYYCRISLDLSHFSYLPCVFSMWQSGKRYNWVSNHALTVLV